MIRCEQKTIIFLINNGGYTIEVEIHDGPYNVIKNWDYTRFVEAINNGQGKCWTAKVSIHKLNNSLVFTRTVTSLTGVGNLVLLFEYLKISFCDTKELLLLSVQVRTEDDLTEAIAAATGPQKDSLCFIEVFVHKDDTSKELLEWGSRVAAANGRPPNPQ